MTFLAHGDIEWLVGVDSYSFHRLLGERRDGEAVPTTAWTTRDVVDYARSVGVEAVSLETCFLDRAVDSASIAELQSEGVEVALAWGHRDGLMYGRSAAATDDAVSWIDWAAAVGVGLVRVVAASPWVTRDRDDVAATIAALARLLDHAAGVGVTIALENHADFDEPELVAIDDGLPRLRWCLDTANALRVGADPKVLVERLGARTVMVHLKDVSRPDGRPTGPTSCRYGHGVVDVDGVLQLLTERSFRGPICVELGHLGSGPVDEVALATDCVRWLFERRAERP